MNVHPHPGIPRSRAVTVKPYSRAVEGARDPSPGFDAPERLACSFKASVAVDGADAMPAGNDGVDIASMATSGEHSSNNGTVRALPGNGRGAAQHWTP